MSTKSKKRKKPSIQVVSEKKVIPIHERVRNMESVLAEKIPELEQIMGRLKTAIDTMELNVRAYQRALVANEILTIEQLQESADIVLEDKFSHVDLKGNMCGVTEILEYNFNENS